MQCTVCNAATASSLSRFAWRAAIQTHGQIIASNAENAHGGFLSASHRRAATKHTTRTECIDHSICMQSVMQNEWFSTRLPTQYPSLSLLHSSQLPFIPPKLLCTASILPVHNFPQPKILFACVTATARNPLSTVFKQPCPRNMAQVSKHTYVHMKHDHQERAYVCTFAYARHKPFFHRDHAYMQCRHLHPSHAPAHRVYICIGEVDVGRSTFFSTQVQATSDGAFFRHVASSPTSSEASHICNTQKTTGNPRNV